MYQIASVIEIPERIRYVMQGNIINIDTLEKRIDIDRFSVYIQLIRVTARVLLMYSRDSQLTFKNVASQLSKKDLEKAELFWVRDAQKCLIDEYVEGKFNRLSAKMRDDGVIVVGTRIDAFMRLSYNETDIMLLPHGHRLSVLYTQFIHSLSHSGVSTTVSKEYKVLQNQVLF